MSQEQYKNELNQKWFLEIVILKHLDVDIWLFGDLKIEITHGTLFKVLLIKK